jgi:hypothetical protein
MERKAIYTLLLEAQQKAVDNLKNSTKGYETEADIDESDGTIDPEDLSQQDTARDMQMRMNLTLNQAKLDLEKIQSFENVQSDTAVAGSIVETQDKYFFMGVGLSNLEVNGKEVLGVSTEAPAYAQILGKKTGDTFTLGNQSFKILSVK